MSRLLLLASLLAIAVCGVVLAVWLVPASPAGTPTPEAGRESYASPDAPDQCRAAPVPNVPHEKDRAKARRPQLPRYPDGQAGAEQSLLNTEVWLDPEWSLELKQRYFEEYKRIIKPDYRFKTTRDKKEQLRILSMALGSCPSDEKLAGDFLRLALHESKYLRLDALSAFWKLTRNPRHIRLQLLRLFVNHLDNDMPLEAFAQNLSIISGFATLPVPREKLPAWRARAVGGSKAARYVAETVDAIAANDGVVPRGIGSYSGIDFQGRTFEPEPEMP